MELDRETVNAIEPMLFATALTAVLQWHTTQSLAFIHVIFSEFSIVVNASIRQMRQGCPDC